MPLEYHLLGLDEAETMLAAAKAWVGENCLPPMAVVVTDRAGRLIACARMDGAAARYLDAAHRKAYTAAVFERDTAAVIDFWARQEKHGHRGPHDWNDRMLTTLPGGFCVCSGQRGGPQSTWDVVGAIGVAGDDVKEHEDAVAEAAVRSLGTHFHHRPRGADARDDA